MSDRIESLTVVLTNDFREEDLESLKIAILQLKGVASVEYGVADINSYIARSRVRSDLRVKIVEFINAISQE